MKIILRAASCMVRTVHKGAVAIEADKVTCSFAGVVAVDRVSLRIAQAKCVALVGESGAGKTTLLRCFNRMIVPLSGRVLVASTDAFATSV